jgi:hypothetical protein
MASHNEILHNWAHQRKPKQKGSRVFYEGRALYSYGNHYLLGYLSNITAGFNSAVLINANKYSKSTGRHRYKAHSAVSHYNERCNIDFQRYFGSNNPVHLFNLIFEEDKYNLFFSTLNARLKEDILDAKQHWKSYRKRADYERASQIIDDYTRLKFFITCQHANIYKVAGKRTFEKLLSKLCVIGATSGIYDRLKVLDDRLAHNRKHLEENRRIRAEKFNAELKEHFPADVQAWRTHSKVMKFSLYMYHSIMEGKKLLRLTEDKKEIETSGGAKFELPAARRLHHLIRTWKADPNTPCKVFRLDNIGGYRNVEWDGEVLSVGCHTIDVSELDYVAKELGWPLISEAA